MQDWAIKSPGPPELVVFSLNKYKQIFSKFLFSFMYIYNIYIYYIYIRYRHIYVCSYTFIYLCKYFGLVFIYHFLFYSTEIFLTETRFLNLIQVSISVTCFLKLYLLYLLAFAKSAWNSQVLFKYLFWSLERREMISSPPLSSSWAALCLRRGSCFALCSWFWDSSLWDKTAWCAT